MCGRCGSKYLGTAAHGRYARYRYHTCFRRHRYGTTEEQLDAQAAFQVLEAGRPVQFPQLNR